MTLNKIYPIEVHMSWGFTREQAIKSIRHDELFNKKQIEGLTEEELEEMYSIIEELDL